MKTLHLTNSWHATSGGIATFYRALMEEANRRHHEIRLVVPGERDAVERTGEFGRIYSVQSPPARLNKSYRTIYPSRFLWPGSRVQQILSAERPDLVEICDKYTLNYLGAVLRRELLPSLGFRPTVVGLSCERMDDNFRSYIGSFRFSGSFCSLYMRWLYFPFFDHHIANSEYTAGELRLAARSQLTSRGTWIRHMGVDLSHLSAARRSNDKRRSLLQKFDAGEESVLLLYVGRLAPEKNLQLLFEVLQRLARTGAADFRLLVVGEGIERKHWESESRVRTPGRAIFLGHIDDRNFLADIYANCDVFVHPNPREPFGIAPLEAMASGLSLVSPNAGGVTSYANSGNAWTVPADPPHFATAIQEAIAEPEKARGKAERALATAQAYCWKNVASSFLDLYSELHQNQAATSPSAAFTSTPSRGFRSALFRVVSKCAERSFSAASQHTLVRRRPASEKIERPGQ